MQIFSAAAALLAIGTIASYQHADAADAVPPAVPSQPGAAGACINFANATTFKTVDRDTIRLSVAGAVSGDFEIDVAGPQCIALDEAKGLAIQSVPSFAVCPGSELGKPLLKFSAEGQSEPLRCTITAVRSASPSTPSK
jgi:hypothetical protein